MEHSFYMYNESLMGFAWQRYVQQVFRNPREQSVTRFLTDDMKQALEYLQEIKPNWILTPRELNSRLPVDTYRKIIAACDNLLRPRETGLKLDNKAEKSLYLLKSAADMHLRQALLRLKQQQERDAVRKVEPVVTEPEPEPEPEPEVLPVKKKKKRNRIDDILNSPAAWSIDIKSLLPPQGESMIHKSSSFYNLLQKVDQNKINESIFGGKRELPRDNIAGNEFAQMILGNAIIDGSKDFRAYGTNVPNRIAREYFHEVGAAMAKQAQADGTSLRDLLQQAGGEETKTKTPGSGNVVQSHQMTMSPILKLARIAVNQLSHGTFEEYFVQDAHDFPPHPQLIEEWIGEKRIGPNIIAVRPFKWKQRLGNAFDQEQFIKWAMKLMPKTQAQFEPEPEPEAEPEQQTEPEVQQEPEVDRKAQIRQDALRMLAAAQEKMMKPTDPEPIPYDDTEGPDDWVYDDKRRKERLAQQGELERGAAAQPLKADFDFSWNIGPDKPGQSVAYLNKWLRNQLEGYGVNVGNLDPEVAFSRHLEPQQMAALVKSMDTGDFNKSHLARSPQKWRYHLYVNDLIAIHFSKWINTVLRGTYRSNVKSVGIGNNRDNQFDRGLENDIDDIIHNRTQVPHGGRYSKLVRDLATQIWTSFNRQRKPQSTRFPKPEPDAHAKLRQLEEIIEHRLYSGIEQGGTPRQNDIFRQLSTELLALLRARAGVAPTQANTVSQIDTGLGADSPVRINRPTA